MKNTIKQSEPAPFKKGVRFIESFAINLPIEKIDLYQWFINMNDLDYRSYSSAHKAIGSYIRDGRFYMTNVENVGTDTIIQNYELKSYSADSVKLYSSRSNAYIMRWVPVFVGVPWELSVKRVSATTSILTCMIGVDYPNPLIRVAAWVNGLGGLFLRQHLRKETKTFALDIQRKFK
jgi:hypothetical protein